MWGHFTGTNNEAFHLSHRDASKAQDGGPQHGRGLVPVTP